MLPFEAEHSCSASWDTITSCSDSWPHSSQCFTPLSTFCVCSFPFRKVVKGAAFNEANVSDPTGSLHLWSDVVSSSTVSWWIQSNSWAWRSNLNRFTELISSRLFGRVMDGKARGYRTSWQLAGCVTTSSTAVKFGKTIDEFLSVSIHFCSRYLDLFIYITTEFLCLSL